MSKNTSSTFGMLLFIFFWLLGIVVSLAITGMTLYVLVLLAQYLTHHM